MMEPGEVVELMENSSSMEDWNANCDLVKRAFGGRYPDFWFAVILASGLKARVQRKWR